MIIEYEGALYEFSYADITIKQAIKIEKHTGLTFAEWGKALSEGGNLRAVQAVGWLILHGGRDVPIEDCDFKVGPLGDALAKGAAEEDAERKAREAAVPTMAAAPPDLSDEGG